MAAPTAATPARAVVLSAFFIIPPRRAPILVPDLSADFSAWPRSFLTDLARFECARRERYVGVSQFVSGHATPLFVGTEKTAHLGRLRLCVNVWVSALC